MEEEGEGSSGSEDDDRNQEDDGPQVDITSLLKQQSDLYNESDEDDHVVRKPSGKQQFKLSKNNQFQMH